MCNRKLYNIIVVEPFNYRPVLDYDMYNNISDELQQTDTDGQDENNINRRRTYYIFCIIYTGVNNILVLHVKKLITVENHGRPRQKRATGCGDGIIIIRDATARRSVLLWEEIEGKSGTDPYRIWHAFKFVGSATRWHIHMDEVRSDITHAGRQPTLILRRRQGCVGGWTTPTLYTLQLLFVWWCGETTTRGSRTTGDGGNRSNKASLH